MKITPIDRNFSICKIEDSSQIDFSDEFCFVGKTDEEISLVCTTSHIPVHPLERDDGWKAFRIQEILDFSLIGILSKISGILAENDIGIFVVSTYNTDYILVKSENFPKALRILESAGYQVEQPLCL